MKNNFLNIVLRIRICLFAMLFCLVSTGVSVRAQSLEHSLRPQPDDDPVRITAPDSLMEILSFDDGKVLSVDKAARVFRLLAIQVNRLQKELGAINPGAKLKASCKPPRAVAKNMRFGPADAGVYAGKFYPPNQ